MLNINNPEIKTQAIHRLARIEGQLRGVQKMIADDRDCKDIVQQMIAIRSALQSASLSFIENVANECLLNFESSGDAEAQRAAMADLVNMLGKITH
jgi:CsoR family transcriptional regulator, copper-sensing transcriptional repressor